MPKGGFGQLQVYQLAERLADEIWTLVERWEHFAKSTVGEQMVEASDSIGANIAEGVGRGAYMDNRRFVHMARGSLYETRHWLRRCWCRKLLTEAQVETLKPIMDELLPRLNAYLRSIDSRCHKPKTNNK
jgi:four helix bundle protein